MQSLRRLSCTTSCLFRPRFCPDPWELGGTTGQVANWKPELKSEVQQHLECDGQFGWGPQLEKRQGVHMECIPSRGY